MEKSFKRAIRRHHLNRLKNNRAWYYGWLRLDPWGKVEVDPKADARHRGMVAHTARLCSCWMCGNPRKHQHEKTLQELSVIEFAKACIDDE